jgi:hypothetical protein
MSLRDNAVSDKAGSGGMAYNGFISYSHAADDRLAPALQRGLQLLAKPWNSRRALRLFRDETGLSTNLGTTVWDVASETPRFSLSDPGNDQTAAFTSDGTSLVVGTAGPTDVIDVATGQIVHQLSPPNQPIAGSGSISPVAVKGDYLLVGERQRSRRHER